MSGAVAAMVFFAALLAILGALALWAPDPQINRPSKAAGCAMLVGGLALMLLITAVAG